MSTMYSERMTDISEWSIVMAAGKTFVGKLDDYVLSPAYELQAGMVPAPNGQIARMMLVTPVMGFASLTKLPIPAQGALVYRVASLSRQEQGDLAKAVANAENIVQAMRAQQSGLVLADSLPKVRQ